MIPCKEKPLHEYLVSETFTQGTKFSPRYHPASCRISGRLSIGVTCLFPFSATHDPAYLKLPHILMSYPIQNFFPCTGILSAFFSPSYHFPGNRSGVKLKLCQDPKRLSADGLFSLPGITGSFAPSQRFKLSYILVAFPRIVKCFIALRYAVSNISFI